MQIPFAALGLGLNAVRRHPVPGTFHAVIHALAQIRPRLGDIFNRDLQEISHHTAAVFTKTPSFRCQT